jgi:carbonic anhydrase
VVKEDRSVRIHNLYEDASGQSHWRDLDVDLSEKTATGRLSKPVAVSALIFRETLPDYDLDWHPAPRRQYIINLEGGVQITASDGESRVIGAGEVILVEDVSGKGHLSKNVEAKLRYSIFVPIEPV